MPGSLVPSEPPKASALWCRPAEAPPSSARPRGPPSRRQMRLWMSSTVEGDRRDAATLCSHTACQGRRARAEDGGELSPTDPVHSCTGALPRPGLSVSKGDQLCGAACGRGILAPRLRVSWVLKDLRGHCWCDESSRMFGVTGGRTWTRAGHTKCSRTNRLWPARLAEAQDTRGLRGPRTTATGGMGGTAMAVEARLTGTESTWEPLCCYPHCEGEGCVRLVCC